MGSLGVSAHHAQSRGVVKEVIVVEHSRASVSQKMKKQLAYSSLQINCFFTLGFPDRFREHFRRYK